MDAAAANNLLLIRKARFGTFQLLLLIVLATCLFTSNAVAQYDPNETAPPPVKVVSKIEKSKLSSAKDIKERTKFALELMDTRISTAEQSLKSKNFDDVFSELGFFQGLLDDQLSFMIRTDNDSGRALDNFKRLELGLRGFSPRIETIRRELPLRYEPFVRSVGKYLRDARTKALEPLFSDTVVRVPNPIN
ncbi:MAG: hypothetical protein ABJA02_13955 [Acidobacteriota bacterium]